MKYIVTGTEMRTTRKGGYKKVRTTAKQKFKTKRSAKKFVEGVKKRGIIKNPRIKKYKM
jgi:hypothetical protein